MKIVVIGAVAAGTSVMAKARRNNENVEIVCYTSGGDISYSGCGIPYFVGEKYISREDLTPRDVSWFKKRFNIDIFIKHEILKVDIKNKKVIIKNLISQEVFEDNYDKLVVATGAHARKLPYEGENIFYVRDITDGQKIKKYILEKNPKKAVIVGGGFIGLEMLESLVSQGIECTILERGDRIGGKLDKDISNEIVRYLEAKKVDIILNDEIEEIKVGYLTTKNGKKIEMDILIGAVGVVPNTDFLNDTGIKLTKEKAIDVNRYLETNIKDIYAVGDCAISYSSLTGEKIYLPLGSTANKMGRILGDRITGGDLEFKGVLGTSIFKVFDLCVAKTGLIEEELEENKIEIIHNIRPNQSEYLKESREMLIKAIADKNTGKLLGVQIVGEKGVDKRIDVFVTLITFGATVDQLFHLDLAYAPPFATTKDPVAYTGMILDNAINGKNKIITPKKLFENRKEYLVIDIRSKAQYEKEHIEGAINISLDKIREELKNLPKGKKIVVHCNKGTTGNAAQNILLNNGFDVYNISGGFKNYKNYLKSK